MALASDGLLFLRCVERSVAKVAGISAGGKRRRSSLAGHTTGPASIRLPQANLTNELELPHLLNYVSISGVEAVPIEFAQSNGAPVLEFGSQLKDG
jgi:hypothetical protein